MNFRSLVLLLAIINFSCESYFDDVKKINIEELIPAGKTENFVLRYTDSANLKAILKSPLNIDYTNQSFPYSEFPNGINIEFFDLKEGSTKVSANYAIVYYRTKIVSLVGNVVIESPDSSYVKSDQIFWDPDQEWLFTEEKIVFSSNDYNIRAEKMDADRSFKLLKTGKLDGNFLFEDQQSVSYTHLTLPTKA